MKINQDARFGVNPAVNIGRSRFYRNSSIKLTCNVGECIPFYLDEVLPGDTFNVKTDTLVRLQTLLTPVADDLYQDIYYFFCPNRLIWQHWKEFQGENTQSAWTPETDYFVPQISSPSGGWDPGTVADYLGIPPGVDVDSINALPFRAYGLIMDQWFRDQNLQSPINVPFNDTTMAGSNGSDYVLDTAFGGKPFIASKYPDFFTTCLPSPQRGSDVSMPIDPLMVVARNESHLPGYVNDFSGVALQSSPGVKYDIFDTSNYVDKDGVRYFAPKTNPSNSVMEVASSGVASGRSPVPGTNDLQRYAPNNLWAVPNIGNVDNPGVSFSINELRLAFATQKLLEKDARGGTRYFEILSNHFGVVSPDATQQRTEYLGGSRQMININQVVQNSQTDSTPQGNVTAYSLTASENHDFFKSFTEHGYIIGISVLRYHHSYGQGIDKTFFRKTRYDYYMPVFANIGEQPVYNKQLYYASDSSANANNDVFGYQEAWGEYRYKPNRVAGEMRPKIGGVNPGDIWTYADKYTSLPYLNESWIKEDKANVDRTLAVQSNVANQVMIDFYVQNESTRPMPMFSIPGLIDHH